MQVPIHKFTASKQKMGSLETINQISGPRISFSADFLDESNFITISPKPLHEEKKEQQEKVKAKSKGEFEFLSSVNDQSPPESMITADELFFEGKLLPFWQIHHAEKLNKISLKPENNAEKPENKSDSAAAPTRTEAAADQQPRMSWFLDDDPSPRPPKCTVLWKELLRLKKQRASSLSLSPSSSSSSSTDEGGKDKENKHVKRIKKGLERTRSASMRIRPVVNVPICTPAQGRSSGLPPLFSMRKGRLDR